MIVIGYPGIGKSDMAGRNKCIDLDCESFWYDNGQYDSWEEIYCKIAVNLSEQSYTVLVSSHENVIKILKKVQTEKVVCIYPTLSLKNEWINKLYVRWNITKSLKDFYAHRHVNENYEKDINMLRTCGIHGYEIQNSLYSLNTILLKLLSN